jgi:hypothetical protein
MSNICGSCWNPINWCESFNKFGHGDGEDCIHTTQVAAEIEKHGYEVEVLQRTIHNPLIVRIVRKGADGNPEFVYSDDIPAGARPGYSNPREDLPPWLIEILDTAFGAGEFFG